MTGSLLLRGARIHRDNILSPGDVLVRNGRIEAVAERISPGDKDRVVELGGLTLLPGFIDLHVHGGGGYSLATTRPEDIEAYSRWVTAHGVTGFLATICGDSFEHGLATVRAAAEARRDNGAAFLGINLEGPFVSPERPGALPRNWLQDPNMALLERLIEAGSGKVRLMTIALELEGGPDLIRAAVRAGIVPAVGHSDATFESARQGFRAGASHVTHAYNAMRPPHHREPATIGAALESPDVTVEVIADGVHLHPATVRLLISAFGPDRVCLVTDAVTPAGNAGGVFQFGEQEAIVTEDSSIRLPDGTIAGSAATMDVVVRNLLEWGLADLPVIARMASSVPARVLGLQARKGAIEPGYDADMVALTEDGRVAMTWVGGRCVYDAESP